MDGRTKRKRREKQIKIRIISGLTIIVLGLIGSGLYLVINNRNKLVAEQEKEQLEQSNQLELDLEKERQELVLEADKVALGYDYDKAIEVIKSNESYEGYQEFTDAITRYETSKANCEEYDINEVSHVFFHSLIVDTEKAFANSYRAKGYNQVMTTADEFRKILNELYANDFVLVNLHQMADYDMDENGNEVFVKQSIMLPEGKKAIVISQDDVCYYNYMTGDGFANRIIIDENGKPTCEMDNEDGTTSVGEYDLVPILNAFIEEHPDFSYRGAKAVLAVTGYDGVFGYRTAPGFIEEHPELNLNLDEEISKAKVVAQGLRDDGYELASHSWGHKYMGTIDFETFKRDTDKWETEVETVIGETDILIFPFGEDIGSAGNYAADNERYQYLNGVGFRYYCNVDASKPYWVQKGDNYLRQGRINLDGYRMYKDYSDPECDRLSYFFDVKKVFDDKTRPLPVPDM